MFNDISNDHRMGELTFILQTAFSFNLLSIRYSAVHCVWQCWGTRRNHCICASPCYLCRPITVAVLIFCCVIVEVVDVSFLYTHQLSLREIFFDIFKKKKKFAIYFGKFFLSIFLFFSHSHSGLKP